MITLNFVIRANAISCLLFGVIFLTVPHQVTVFLAAQAPAPKALILILGAGLIINGLHLFWASLQLQLSRRLVMYFSIGDFIWLLACVSLIVMGTWIDTMAGILTTLVVALMVGVFGGVQVFISRKSEVASSKLEVASRQP